MADRAAAEVALASGDASPAADRALASAAAADDVGVPVEAALSRALAGRALAQTGERDDAIAELERAAHAFHACGARRTATRRTTSCDCSVAASIGVRNPARATRPASPL